MGKLLTLFSLILISNLITSSAQDCTTYSFTNNAIYTTCVSLPVQNSHLHWNYHPTNATVDVAYRHTGVSTSEWVAWALNVDGAGMVGAQALVALPNSNGSVQAYTSAVTGYGTALQPSALSFDVPEIRAEMVNGDVVIYGTLTHGVLNAVSWGVLMPMGAMVARYLKVFKMAHPAWFYIHVACQVTAYGVGVAGWATGLKLGSDSEGLKYTTHRNIGITLFVFGTLQVFALLLRPKPDHKYRIYWNIYHTSIGYAVISLSITNVYKGLGILDPEKKWKNAYTGVIISFGVITAILEAFTWFIVLKRKKAEKEQGPVGNGAYGANGYGHHNQAA
ncbi:hypothetical protein L1987_74178 [Smallanthus sonchifolius]|uniref:Uncharacterized protein n=1 Tax=Smallanthus sonchifolius TaxID=185202 RepID=A0ACB9A2C1_9ASTR|nr:hypothetical protein L1987_74178 [Smallanthus sonchifolius]